MTADFSFEKQHAKGKYHIVERLSLLLDKGSFCEITGEGILAERDGVILGKGRVGGVEVYVFGQDFTEKGGSVGLVHGQRIAYLIRRAVLDKKTVIGIYDSVGARIDEGVDALAGCGEFLYENVQASGKVAQVSVVLGTCAGASCYSPALSDFVFSVPSVGKMFVTGSDVVKDVTGEVVSADELGNALLQAKAGVIHNVYENEKKCFEEVAKLIRLFSRHVIGDYSEQESSFTAKAVCLPSKETYDVRGVLREVFDEGSFFELHTAFAPNITVGFASLCGKTVGIVANNPCFSGGVIDCDASDKGARFIRFCDSFDIPVVTFVDTPGYLPGVEQERKGVIRHGAKLLYAYAEATVAKITFVIRKAFGGAYIAMGSKHIGGDKTYILPEAQCAVMGAESAVKIVFKKELALLNEAEKEAFVREKCMEYSEKQYDTTRLLRQGYAKEIRPEEIRRQLYEDLKELPCEGGRHGNTPL